MEQELINKIKNASDGTFSHEGRLYVFSLALEAFLTQLGSDVQRAYVPMGSQPDMASPDIGVTYAVLHTGRSIKVFVVLKNGNIIQLELDGYAALSLHKTS